MESEQTIRIVPHLDSNKALIFPVMEIRLIDSNIIKIGRSISDNRNNGTNQMTFKSKVVSRKHAEIYLKSGKVYLRDTRSSSGTFLNSRRLCSPNTISQPFEIHDNDIIQLGVDYQGGTEEIYRCVKMKLDFNKPNRLNDISQYNLKTFNSLQHFTKQMDIKLMNNQDEKDSIHIEECCICLFAIAPFQALFVAPCSHTFHFKCLRPLLINYPGFSCPLCRNYSDLDANITVEVDEVKAMLETMKIPKKNITL